MHLDGISWCCGNLPAYEMKQHNGFHLDASYGCLLHEVLILTALDYGKQWVLAAVINILSIIGLLMLVFLMVWIIASSWIKAVVRKIMSIAS